MEKNIPVLPPFYRGCRVCKIDTLKNLPLFDIHVKSKIHLNNLGNASKSEQKELQEEIQNYMDFLGKSKRSILFASDPVYTCFVKGNQSNQSIITPEVLTYFKSFGNLLKISKLLDQDGYYILCYSTFYSCMRAVVTKNKFNIRPVLVKVNHTNNYHSQLLFLKGMDKLIPQLNFLEVTIDINENQKISIKNRLCSYLEGTTTKKNYSNIYNTIEIIQSPFNSTNCLNFSVDFCFTFPKHMEKSVQMDVNKHLYDLNLNFKSYESVENITIYNDPKTDICCNIRFNHFFFRIQKVLSLYFNLDRNLKLIANAIKYWIKLHVVKGDICYSSHIVALLLIFYLQHPPFNFPPLSKISLAEVKQGRFKFYPNVTKYKQTSPLKIMNGFFSFYADFDFKNNIICLLLGKVVFKHLLKNKSSWPKQFVTKEVLPKTFIKDHTSKENISIIGFDLSHNLATKNLLNVTLFQKHCLIAKHITAGSEKNCLYNLYTYKPSVEEPHSEEDNLNTVACITMADSYKNEKITENTFNIWIEVMNNFILYVFSNVLRMKIETFDDATIQNYMNTQNGLIKYKCQCNFRNWIYWNRVPHESKPKNMPFLIYLQSISHDIDEFTSKVGLKGGFVQFELVMKPEICIPKVDFQINKYFFGREDIDEFADFFKHYIPNWFCEFERNLFSDPDLLIKMDYPPCRLYMSNESNLSLYYKNFERNYRNKFMEHVNKKRVNSGSSSNPDWIIVNTQFNSHKQHEITTNHPEEVINEKQTTINETTAENENIIDIDIEIKDEIKNEVKTENDILDDTENKIESTEEIISEIKIEKEEQKFKISDYQYSNFFIKSENDFVFEDENKTNLMILKNETKLNDTDGIIDLDSDSGTDVYIEDSSNESDETVLLYSEDHETETFEYDQLKSFDDEIAEIVDLIDEKEFQTSSENEDDSENKETENSLDNSDLRLKLVDIKTLLKHSSKENATDLSKENFTIDTNVIEVEENRDTIHLDKDISAGNSSKQSNTEVIKIVNQNKNSMGIDKLTKKPRKKRVDKIKVTINGTTNKKQSTSNSEHLSKPDTPGYKSTLLEDEETSKNYNEDDKNKEANQPDDFLSQNRTCFINNRKSLDKNITVAIKNKPDLPEKNSKLVSSVCDLREILHNDGALPENNSKLVTSVCDLRKILHNDDTLPENSHKLVTSVCDLRKILHNDSVLPENNPNSVSSVCDLRQLLGKKNTKHNEGKSKEIIQKSGLSISIENRLGGSDRPSKSSARKWSPIIFDDNQQRPSLQDHHRRPSLQDNLQRPSLQDNQKRPSLQDNQKRPSLQDHQHRPPIQDNQQRPSLQLNQQRPSLQEPRNSKFPKDESKRSPERQRSQSPKKLQERRKSTSPTNQHTRNPKYCKSIVIQRPKSRSPIKDFDSTNKSSLNKRIREKSLSPQSNKKIKIQDKSESTNKFYRYSDKIQKDSEVSNYRRSTSPSINTYTSNTYKSLKTDSSDNNNMNLPKCKYDYKIRYTTRERLRSSSIERIRSKSKERPRSRSRDRDLDRRRRSIDRRRSRSRSRSRERPKYKYRRNRSRERSKEKETFLEEIHRKLKKPLPTTASSQPLIAPQPTTLLPIPQPLFPPHPYHISPNLPLQYPNNMLPYQNPSDPFNVGRQQTASFSVQGTVTYSDFTYQSDQNITVVQPPISVNTRLPFPFPTSTTPPIEQTLTVAVQNETSNSPPIPKHPKRSLDASIPTNALIEIKTTDPVEIPKDSAPKISQPPSKTEKIMMKNSEDNVNLMEMHTKGRITSRELTYLREQLTNNLIVPEQFAEKIAVINRVYDFLSLITMTKQQGPLVVEKSTNTPPKAFDSSPLRRNPYVYYPFNSPDFVPHTELLKNVLKLVSIKIDEEITAKKTAPTESQIKEEDSVIDLTETEVKIESSDSDYKCIIDLDSSLKSLEEVPYLAKSEVGVADIIKSTLDQSIQSAPQTKSFAVQVELTGCPLREAARDHHNNETSQRSSQYRRPAGSMSNEDNQYDNEEYIYRDHHHMELSHEFTRLSANPDFVKSYLEYRRSLDLSQFWQDEREYTNETTKSKSPMGYYREESSRRSYYRTRSVGDENINTRRNEYSQDLYYRAYGDQTYRRAAFEEGPSSHYRSEYPRRNSRSTSRSLHLVSSENEDSDNAYSYDAAYSCYRR